MTTKTQRQTALEQTISRLAGLPVELTVRGLRSFTFSFDAWNDQAEHAICKFFAEHGPRVIRDGEIIEGDDCRYTCVFVDIA